MNLSISDYIGIVGVAATVFLGFIALWQNARYKKQSDDFIDLQSMPELFPVRNFDFGFGKIMEKMPISLQTDISDHTGNTMYFNVFYAENGPIYDLTVLDVKIDGKSMISSLKCNPIDIYPMNKYLRLSLIVPTEFTNNQKAHKGQITLSYKNQYNVGYEKKLIFDFAGTQVSAEKIDRAKRITAKYKKAKFQFWIQDKNILPSLALYFSKVKDKKRLHKDSGVKKNYIENGAIIHMWDTLKVFIKKHFLLVAIVAILFSCVVVPVLINIVFKQNWGISWLQAEWHANDALSFYGTLLAASIGIIGVFFSIQYAQKNYREDAKSRVRPYLALTYLRENSQFKIENLIDLLGYSSVDDKEIKEETSEEQNIFYRLDNFAIVLSEKGIKYQLDISDQQKKLIQNGGFITDEQSIKKHKFISMPFIIENVGNGAALNCRIAFYKENDVTNGINLNTIKCGGLFNCHIFSDEPKAFLNQKYILKFAYLDILGTEYTQSYDIQFTIDPDTQLIAQTILLKGEQQEESIWNI